MKMNEECVDLDNRPVKSNSGVWKPEPSVLHRLQGN